jgi:hypothetical protein
MIQKFSRRWLRSLLRDDNLPRFGHLQAGRQRWSGAFETSSPIFYSASRYLESLGDLALSAAVAVEEQSACFVVAIITGSSLRMFIVKTSEEVARRPRCSPATGRGGSRQTFSL